MRDYFKTLREPLIEQQKKTDKKQDELIEQLKGNQERIRIRIYPQKAIAYSGDTLPNLDWDEELEEQKEEEDEKDEFQRKPSTSKTAKKVSILNPDKGINDEYKTLLEDKGYDLASEIFNEKKMLMI